MASFSFRSGENAIYNLSGSGLGFFGEGFGQSVNVGEYQETTFITNGTGSSEGPMCSNIRWTHANSGVINESGDDVLLTQIPNYLATLMVDFTHDSPIQVQNVEARIYDRVNINNAASGVLTRVAEIVHPDPVQNDNGSGDTSWATPAGSAIILTLSDSPGISGWYASNGSSQRPDTVHRWHLALSASPSSVGSKALYGFYIECEYL